MPSNEASRLSTDIKTRLGIDRAQLETLATKTRMLSAELFRAATFYPELQAGLLAARREITTSLELLERRFDFSCKQIKGGFSLSAHTLKDDSKRVREAVQHGLNLLADLGIFP